MSAPATPEPREVRLKRLAMRSMRRGIKEMDVILSAFADRELAAMAEDEVDAYEALLSENDHDLYAWVSGAAPLPPEHAQILTRIQSGLDASGVK